MGLDKCIKTITVPYRIGSLPYKSSVLHLFAPPSLPTALETRPWSGGSVGWSIVPYTKKVVGSIPALGTYRR